MQAGDLDKEVQLHKAMHGHPVSWTSKQIQQLLFYRALQHQWEVGEGKKVEKHRNKHLTLEFCGVYERNKKPRDPTQRRAPFRKVCIIKDRAKKGISSRKNVRHTDTGNSPPYSCTWDHITHSEMGEDVNDHRKN